MELIPFIGPFLGALPPMLVALFQDPITAVWVGLLFVALQQIEGHIVAPQIFGHALRINPLLVIFALLVGAELYGFLGALIALPVAAIAARDRRLPARAPRPRAVGAVARPRSLVGPSGPPARRSADVPAEDPTARAPPRPSALASAR